MNSTLKKIYKSITRPLLSQLYDTKLRIDLSDNIKVKKLKDEGRLLQMEDLHSFFKGKSVFTFGTGGSIANLKLPERLKDKNLVIVTTGFVRFYLTYGIVPNIWLVHNPETVIQTIDLIKKHGLLEKINFDEVIFLVPSNNSTSKIHSHFSAAPFKQFRNFINHRGVYVLYNENFRGNIPETVHDSYLEEFANPIRGLRGTAVESLYLPFMRAIGVKTIFVCGVDNMETGHFWDRNHQYQTVQGKPLSFEAITPKSLISRSVKVAKEKCHKLGAKVFRLEPEETILKDFYELIDFDKALQMADKRITATDLISGS